jgi:hypothetical protein
MKKTETIHFYLKKLTDYYSFTVKLLLFVLICSFSNKSYSNGTQSQPYVLTPANNASFSQFTNSSSEVWFSFTAVDGNNFFELN